MTRASFATNYCPFKLNELQKCIQKLKAVNLSATSYYLATSASLRYHNPTLSCVGTYLS